uniref:outer dense fiber protein 2b isoform X2 n=1 Tax=Doryrhamphus excisus TaxID=161450 RepID=UPI0025AE994D|nr:outer dense fiber protein 2b isoform X2 [Doryrhamphus excisus]
MRTRHSPPPVHVHVPETTPVHVHMRRSPTRTPQDRTTDAQVKGERGRSRGRAPWIPPGISSLRLDPRNGRGASDGARQGTRDDDDDDDDDADAITRDLNVLLKEQQSQRSKKGAGADGSCDVLLRALVEAEVDGVAVANQLSALKETLDGVSKDKRPSKLQTSRLGRQRLLLLEKMEIFDNTNHGLRELLRERADSEGGSLRLSEENQAFKKRLADCQADNVRLVSKLSDKEKEVSRLAECLSFEKEHAKTSEELSRILGSTRDHLESQLSRSQAEKLQLAAQLQESYRHRQGNGDHAALAEEASRRLREKESQLAQALSTCSDLRLRHAKEASARGQLEDEVAALKIQVSERSAQLHVAEERSRAERAALRDELHGLSADKASVTLDKQTLQAQVTSCKEKLGLVEDETRQLKTSLRKQEAMLDKYKRKAQQAELQWEELRVKGAELEKAAASQEREKEELREELARLRQLEDLPERLRRARQEADAHQRRSLEHNSALAEVRRKVEEQGAQLEASQRRNLLLHEENNVLKERVHNLERKLEDMTLENKEMCQALRSKEASVQSVEQQLETKVRECGVLTRQLQQALDDAHQQADDSMHRVLAKERASQSKALDLQGQLSRAEAELSQLHRSKEEMERRFQNQLKNLKERLEQSDSTNRSLQNYVHFLKTSYGNVFGESLLSA